MDRLQTSKFNRIKLYIPYLIGLNIHNKRIVDIELSNEFSMYSLRIIIYYDDTTKTLASFYLNGIVAMIYCDAYIIRFIRNSITELYDDKERIFATMWCLENLQQQMDIQKILGERMLQIWEIIPRM